MQPLSKARRRIYLGVLTILFFVLIPVVALYATGYRYKSGFGLVQTGGIYVAVPYSGAAVALDGKEIGQSGFLQRSFFIDNLTPGAYEITARLAGFIPWRRIVVVEQRLVTDTSVLLVPKEVRAIQIVLPGATTSTSTLAVSPATFSLYRVAFSLPLATTSASSIAGEVVALEDGNVYVRWSDSSALPPSVFCGRPSYCTTQIPIEQATTTAISAVFYAGGVVYATREHGVFLSEVDARPDAVVAPLYPRGGSDFRVVNGDLIIKDGTSYYVISF